MYVTVTTTGQKHYTNRSLSKYYTLYDGEHHISSILNVHAHSLSCRFVCYVGTHILPNANRTKYNSIAGRQSRISEHHSSTDIN